MNNSGMKNQEDALWDSSKRLAKALYETVSESRISFERLSLILGYEDRLMLLNDISSLSIVLSEVYQKIKCKNRAKKGS